MSHVSVHTLRVTAWLRSFTDKLGDRMPMSDEIHLPSCLTKADVYELAVDDLMQGGDTHCPSISIFYEVWRSQFPHVKIPKVCIAMQMTYALHVCISILVSRGQISDANVPRESQI